jgi:hypothetical protein
MSAPIHRNRIERNHLFWKQWQQPEQRGGELKSECEAADQTKRQKRDQASPTKPAPSFLASFDIADRCPTRTSPRQSTGPNQPIAQLAGETMRKEAGGVPAVTGDSESNLTWSADKAAPTRQPGGVNTPGPYRPSANARTLNRQPEELATEWACSAAQPFGGRARSSCDSDFAPGPRGVSRQIFFPAIFAARKNPCAITRSGRNRKVFLLEGLLPIGIF